MIEEEENQFSDLCSLYWAFAKQTSIHLTYYGFELEESYAQKLFAPLLVVGEGRLKRLKFGYGNESFKDMGVG